MALEGYIDLLEKLGQGNLVVRAGRCVSVRNRNVECRRCVQACTSDCIGLVRNGDTEFELHVQPDKCIGCGTCATACPTGALAPRQPDDRELAHEAAACMRATGGVVVFACAELVNAAQGLFEPQTVVGVPCVGRVDESLVVLLAAAGATEIRLATGDCETCGHRAGAVVAAQVQACASTLLRTWNSRTALSVSRKLPAQCRAGKKGPTFDAARREFLLAVRSGAADAAHDAIDASIDRFFDVKRPRPQHQHVLADGTMPHAVPVRRQVLLDALGQLGRPADELVATRLWGHVVIDGMRCDGCRMCAVFCPTGALAKLVEEGHEAGLAHAPDICVKCHTCETVCTKGALELSDEVFAVDMGAGAVERFAMKEQLRLQGDPDAMRKAMAKKINSAYIWG